MLALALAALAVFAVGGSLAPSAAAAAAAGETAVVTNQAIVDAPIEEVWRAWTTKEGMESWMVGKTDFELKVGGEYRTSYNKTSTLDDDATIHQQLLAFDPGRMIAMRTVKPPKGFPFPNAILRTWSVAYLESAGATQTRVVTRMFGFSDDEESQKMRAFFERGNQATLDSLVKRFAHSAH
jgi:uncharacterized protein YndB with AHSA1/START domain